MKKYKTYSDDRLIKDFQSDQDLEILATLYQRYTAQVFGVCLKYFKNRVDAEDASMEIYGLLIKRLPGKEIERFGPWLYTVVKNHCLEKLRTTQRKLKQKKEAEIMYSQEIYHPDIETNVEKKIQLKDCLSRLKEIQKQCVNLFYFEKLNYDEIAEKMELDWNQVRSNIQNGRRNLRICLEKYGHQ